MIDKECLRKTAPARIDFDAAIKQDDRILEEILTLLGGLVPLSDWPPHLVSALAGAIAEGDTHRVEAEKARRLRRHLFGDMPHPGSRHQARSRAAGRIDCAPTLRTS